MCRAVGGGLSMFTKPVKVPMREQWNLPLFSRDSLAVMIHLLTHQNRNHFLSSPFMPYEGSVRYISLDLKYCYLETRCWAAALSLFDKLNLIVNCGNLLYASCLVLSLRSGYRETIVLFLKATSAGILLFWCIVMETTCWVGRGEVQHREEAVSLENPYVLTTNVGIISMSGIIVPGKESYSGYRTGFSV